MTTLNQGFDFLYEPPAPNVVRDGDFIVAPRAGAVFPNRCVMTNELLPAANFQLYLRNIPQQMDAPLPFETSFIGRMLLVVASGITLATVGVGILPRSRPTDNWARPICYTIGLYAEHRRRLLDHDRIGYWLLLCSGFILFVPCLLVELFRQIGPFRQAISNSVYAIVGITSVGTAITGFIAGLIFKDQGSIPPLSVQKCRDNRVWLGGACREYLDMLPIASQTRSVSPSELSWYDSETGSYSFPDAIRPISTDELPRYDPETGELRYPDQPPTDGGEPGRSN